MKIIEDLIPKGQGVRTGKRLTKCLGLVIHWIGAAQGRASVIRGNFGRSECGTQYIIDWYDGHIVRCVPEGEVCYHVGGASYTALKRALCGEENPNWYFVGIECCIGDKAIPADWSAAGKHMDLGKPCIAERRLDDLCAIHAQFRSAALAIECPYISVVVLDMVCPNCFDTARMSAPLSISILRNRWFNPAAHLVGIFSAWTSPKPLQYVSISAGFWLASQKICAPICTPLLNQRFLSGRVPECMGVDVRETMPLRKAWQPC